MSRSRGLLKTPESARFGIEKGPVETVPLEREMRFELTTSTLAVFAYPTTPFEKFSNINKVE